MICHRSRSEHTIRRAVFQHLGARRARGTFAFHVPSGSKRKPIEAAIPKDPGVVAGAPGVIACYAMDTKSEGGKPTPAQLEVMHQMEHAGATVALGLDAAILVGRAA
jgi:hypothetical protein